MNAIYSEILAQYSTAPDTTVILTPNKRLSAYLRQQFVQHYQANNQFVWHSIKVLPIATWLENSWLDCGQASILLSNSQEYFLWCKIIADSNSAPDVGNTAVLAQQAWKLCQQWELVDKFVSRQKQLDLNSTEEIRTFQRWSQKFNHACQQHEFICHSQLPTILSTNLVKSNFKPPQQLLLIGFDDAWDGLDQQLSKFLHLLQQHGSHIDFIDINQQNSKQQRMTCLDQKQEIITMAEWSKALLAADPTITIGCVVPGLMTCHTEITQIFMQVFAPELAWSCNTDHTDLPFNVSGGTNLMDYPMIQHAITVLLLTEPLKLDTINKILLSPFISQAASNLSSRALAEAEIRTHNKLIFSFSELIALLSKHPDLVTIIKLHQQILSPLLSQKRSCAAWTKTFTKLLQLWGWPGEYSLNSTEYQLFNHWQELLRKFTTLDLVLTQMPYDQALHILRSLATKTMFQPQSNIKQPLLKLAYSEEVKEGSERKTGVYTLVHEDLSTEPTHKLPEEVEFQQRSTPPVQILGTLEAAGINFDYLWVMGMHNMNWPPAANPNPFIPLAWQKQLEMPHASAQRELSYCQKMLARFACSASNVIYSYAKHLDAQISVQPSALINALPETTLPNLPSSKHYTLAREMLSDDRGPPIPEATVANGGSSILTLQAQCPFRAFATLRLNATPLPEPQLGMTKIARGIIIHAALERIWQKIQTQQQLRNHSEATIRNLIMAVLTDLGITYLDQKCLTDLLWRWLQEETQRPDFTIVAMEKTQIVNLGNLAIKLRLDRIDKLTSGEEVVIDYKTGKVLPSTDDWFGARPKAPQLMLYCVSNTDVDAIALAQVYTSTIKFKLITLESMVDALANSTEQHGITAPTVAQLKHHWSKTLHNLAADFCNGLAAVNPIDPQICENCDLEILCRIKK